MWGGYSRVSMTTFILGGPEMAPKPPNARSAPGNPRRSSTTAPIPPDARSAPGDPWRSSTSFARSQEASRRGGLGVARVVGVVPALELARDGTRVDAEELRGQRLVVLGGAERRLEQALLDLG